MTVARTPEELETFLEKTPSLKPHARAITQRALPAIVITPQRKKDAAALGASRMGGSPDLPKGMPWPRFTATRAELEERYIASSVASILDSLDCEQSIDLPFAFIAQFRLEELASHDANHKLPSTGLLSFFFRPDLMFEEKVLGEPAREWRYRLPCAVIYSEHDDQTLETATTPADLASWIAPSSAMTFSAAMLLPDYPQLGIELTRGRNAYIKLTIAQMDLPEYQLLTFPTGTHDVDVPPKDGQLLLSTRLPEVMFDGAFSCCYFCIADEALQRRAFDQTYVLISSE